MLYALVAAVATVANIACQMLVMWIYDGVHAVPLSVLAGTAAGLPIKYVLEKRNIFAFDSDSLAHDGRLFALYTFLGAFTTAIFWGVEFAFHWIFASDLMRYLGGIIGLALGYTIKYQLDKRFVFVRRASQAAGVA